MKKILVAGVCALALSATGALAQTGNNNESNNPTAKPGMMKNETGMRHSGTTGMSTQGKGSDSAVPGSTNAGGTSQTSPNTVKPGASKQGN
jgi:hypothetical protein